MSQSSFPSLENKVLGCEPAGVKRHNVFSSKVPWLLPVHLKEAVLNYCCSKCRDRLFRWSCSASNGSSKLLEQTDAVLRTRGVPAMESKKLANLFPRCFARSTFQIHVEFNYQGCGDKYGSGGECDLYPISHTIARARMIVRRTYRIEHAMETSEETPTVLHIILPGPHALSGHKACTDSLRAGPDLSRPLPLRQSVAGPREPPLGAVLAGVSKASNT